MTGDERRLSILRLVISFGLLTLLGIVFRKQLGACFTTVRNAEVHFLLLALLAYILFIWISAWRWQVLLTAQGLYFPSWYLARVFVLGLFFCKLLPTSIGGDVMRIAYTTKPTKGAEAFSATFLDRLIGFESLSFLAVVTALFVAMQRADALSLGGNRLTGFGVVLFLFAIFLLLFLFTMVLLNEASFRFLSSLLTKLDRRIPPLHRLTELLTRAYQAVQQYRHRPLALFLSFLSGIGVQAALSLAWFFSARAVMAKVPLGYYFIFIPLLNIVVNIPTIGGLGVREAAFVLFFTPNWLPGHLGKEQALATSLLFLALDLAFALLGGLFFAFMRRAGKEQPVSEPEGLPYSVSGGREKQKKED